MVYKVLWTQTLQDEFTIEADNEEEAIIKVQNGECGDVNMIVDNEFKVVETLEHKPFYLE